MERYTTDQNGNEINYRYTKETEEEFVTRIIKAFASDKRFLTEEEAEEKTREIVRHYCNEEGLINREDAKKMMVEFVVSMGFAENPDKRQGQVRRMLNLIWVATTIATLALTAASNNALEILGIHKVHKEEQEVQPKPEVKVDATQHTN